jgi:hypothetical protein
MTPAQRLWQRQAELVHRSGVLRERLAAHAQALAPAMAAADRVRDTASWMRAHPWVPLGLGLLWLWRRPRRGLRWTWKAWQGWRWWMRQRRAWAAGRGG